MLVHMPYAAVERPSIGLGTLQACLAREGLPAQVLYANLRFAERVGLSAYRAVELTPTDVFLGEWTFAGAAFPDYHPEVHPDAGPAFAALRAQAQPFVDELVEEILRSGARVVGAGSTFQQHCASLALLRRLKERNPYVVTVLGGANCEGPMGSATHREFPWVDFVVSGEADDLAPDLFRRLLEGQAVTHPSVLTPALRGATLGRGTLQAMDSVPVPDYTDYFAELARLGVGKKIEPGLLIETSRGCWWGERHHCTFCGLNGTGMGFRSKSPDRAVADFTALEARYSRRNFEVVDNILDMKYFQSVLPQLEGRGYSIFYETKANLKREQVEQLARSGVRWIQPGIESLSDEVLKLMDKGSTAMTNVQLLKWTREFGVRVSWNFLAGFPGETDEWYAEIASWLPLVAHLQPPGRTVDIRYERFSPYHSRPADYGVELRPNRYYRYVYPLGAESLSELAYFFEDHSPRPGPGPGRRALDEAVEAWAGRFWTGMPVILSMTDDGRRLHLIDTRPCAPARHVVLEGEERELYLACDTPLKEGPAELLARLVERKLVLSLNGRYLALAVRGNLPAMPRNRDFPGGIAL